MTSQSINLVAKGLYSSPNNLSGVPQGAYELADNVVINSKNLTESRRGQTQYGTTLTIGAGQVNKLFNYSSSLLVNYSTKMAYDSGSGTWVDYSGSYSPPSASYKIRSMEALRNFYFNSSTGVYKIDALASTPVLAGVVRALGGSSALTGTGGFLLNNSAVAYRIIWGYTDANNNLILGAPSQRLVVTNNSGPDVNVILTYLIPASITTSYFYQIYRSNGTAAYTDEPSDELQLVLQGNPTSGEISAKTFSVTDTTPYSLMRATLYTSPSQEGIANANTPPPYCVDMDIYKNCAFYGNIKQKQILSLALIAVDSPAFGYYVDASVGTTNLDPVLTGIASTANLRAGMKCVGTGIPTTARILNIASGTSVTMTVNATATATVSVEFQDKVTIAGVDYFGGTSNDVTKNQFLVDISGTPAQDINTTAENLIQIMNTSSSNTTIYGYYISGIEDLPGQMLFEERAIGGNSFAATSTYGASFSPTLPSSGTTISSTNEEKQNRVLVSKNDQVEAVPTYRFFDVGSANFAIKKVVALRDGIFFFKDDGIYRLSGETFNSFTVNLVDNTVTLQVPESAVAFNNQIFFFSTQGICAATDAGVRIMSVPIEDTLLELSSDQFTNFVTTSFGVAYESARLYLFWTVTEEDDTYATQAFCYNSLTDTWTRWPLSRTCGIVNTGVNKLYMAIPDSGQIRVERKSFTTSDFADEQYSVTISSVDSSTQVTLASATNVVAGMTLIQDSRNAYIEEVNSTVLTITATPGLTAAAAIVYTPIMNSIKWTPIDAENPGILKQFSECTFFFKNAAFREIDAGFSSNISPNEETVTIENFSGVGQWGNFPWGDQPWGGSLGGSAPLRTYVPRDKQRSSWLGISLTTNEAFTGFSLQGVSIVFNPMSTRFK